MKSAKPVASILLFLSLFFVSCSSHQDNLFTTSEIISRGDWGVAYLNTGLDKTAEFEKCSLTFTPDGKISCISDNQNFSGTWGMIRDEKGNDLLTITIAGPNNLIELSNKWNVTQKSTTDISLLSKGEAKQLRIRRL